MRKVKRLTGKLLAVMLAGTLTMGSLSMSVFADEDTSDASGASIEEMAEGDFIEDSEESTDEDFSDTVDSAAENVPEEAEDPEEETPASEDEPGLEESEDAPEEDTEASEDNPAEEQSEEDTEADFEQETAAPEGDSAVPEEDAENPEMIPQDSEQVELEYPPAAVVEDHLDPVYSDGVKASMGAARRSAAGDVVDLSSMTILPTDVSVPSSGCVLLGLQGKYISEVDAALDLINEIRLEACREGVVNPDTNMPLTEADYVPIKWSRQLEYIARIRAAEAAITIQHMRTNGNDVFSLKSEDGTKSWGEVLAWNWSDSMTEGIEQWYEEKADWVNNTPGAVTGHYTQMIDPTHLYIGLGTFCSNSTPYYNSTAGEFSFEDNLDESSIEMAGDCIQTLEVNSSYLSGSAAISGASEGTAGESSDYILSIGTSIPKGSRSYTSNGLIFLNNVSWSSSDAAVASVSGGTVTAKKCGKTVISASNADSGKSAELTFTVNHIEKTLPARKPTCTESGLTEGTQCSACGEILKAQEVIQATGHTSVTDKAVAATCTEDGLTEGSHCSVCGQVLKAQTVIKATGHAWGSGVVTKQPTCTTSGTRTYTCGNDKSHTKTETINALGHTTVTDKAVAATCTEDGLTEGSHCATCGEILKAQTVVKATGHAWDSGVVTKQPTCTTSGTRTYTCGNDMSHTKTETINALGHTTVTDKAVAATCTESGLTEGSHCSVCGQILKAQETIPAAGHKWDEGTVRREPTCTEDGEKVATCQTCKKTETLAIPAKGHTFGDWTVLTPPTYEHEGRRERTCTACSIVEQETMEALPRISLANASITGLSPVTYTGAAFRPAPIVKMGSTTLKLNTDYTVSYSNNTNAGTATVTVTGTGKYTGTKTAHFTINKAAQNISIRVSTASIAVGRTATVSISGNVGAKSYKSSLAVVAAVNAAGTITAKKAGSTTITATAAATANYKAASKTVSIKVVPAATASITAANQATGIKLTWKSVAGATGYRIYRGSSLIRSITSGSTITCTDTTANTNGALYTFRVVPTAPTGTGLARTLAVYRLARPAVSSVKNSAARKMTVRWTKNAKANGYQIQYSTNRKFASGNKTVNITRAAAVSRVIGGLAKGKTYYVRIRTYRTVGNSKWWSVWSPAKSVKVKK